MKPVTRIVPLIALAGVVASAGGQTFVTYMMSGENRTNGGRGLDDAQPGDLIRIAMKVEHDAFAYAGGKVEFLSDGVERDDMRISEDFVHWDPWQVGRNYVLRMAVSDAPEFAPYPYNEIVVGFPDGTITDVNDDFIDLASTPPGLGGISGAFPLVSGQDVFRVDYIYDGGIDLWDAGHSGRARLWRDDSDLNGIEVPAFNGDTLVVSPAPAGVVLLGIAACAAGRRRGV